jgi:glycosyltransferase involved in cell wall biosynthesis
MRSDSIDNSIHIEVASLKPPGPVGTMLRDAGINVHSLDASRIWQLKRVARRLRDLIKAREIDTVFSFLVHANFVSRWAVEKSDPSRRIRLFESIQTTQPHPRWHWWTQRWASRKCDRVIVPSPSVARIAQQRCGIPADRIVVIPNAVDACQFSIARDVNLARLNIEGVTTGDTSHAPARCSDTFRLGFVGRLDPVKRINALIEAMRRLPDNITLDIFGDGVERQRLEALAFASGERIRFHGAIPNPAHAYAGLDALVLPSSAEGFGLVLIEAMASAVPVVAARAPGIVDVIEHDVNGLLADDANNDSAAYETLAENLARAVLRLHDDTSLRLRLIHAGITHVECRYDWPAVLALYRRVLDCPNPGDATLLSQFLKAQSS